MSLDQLKALFQNPSPNSPPLWAVISALAEKQKEAQAMMAAQGQSAMAQNAQMQQKPPVAAQVVQAAEQMQEPVMAAYGGEMQSYADGGPVAFRYGGDVQYFSDGSNEFGLMADPAAEALDALRVEREQAIIAAKAEREQKAKQLKELEETYYSLMMQQDPRAAQVKKQLDALDGRGTASSQTPIPMRLQDTRGGTPEMAALARALGSGPVVAGPRRQPAAVTKPVTPMDQGLGALAEQPPPPAIDARAAAAAAEQEAMRRRGEVTPEMIAARGGIDKLLGDSAATFAGETKRRKDLAQQRMQEALGRFERPGLQDMAGIGRLLGGMRGAKTLYEGLTGAGAAAGRYQEDKESALRAAQEKFDLSGKEVFELSRLQDQVRMKQAELAEARASGDAQRSVQAAIDVAQSQKQLAEYQNTIDIKRQELGFKSREVKAAEDRAMADLIQARRPTEFQQKMDLYRRDPATFEKLFGAREKNSYDVINDNAQKKFNDWASSVSGMTATPAQRNAMWQEILDREIETAKRFGLKTPEGATGPASGNQLPPAAVSQLKEGLVTTFANGQKWTLQNGQPTQVK